MCKTAIKMLWIERKKAKELIISIITTIIVSSIFLQLYDNGNLWNKNLGFELSTVLLGPFLIFFILVLCISLLSYSYYHYTLLHSQEMALIKLAGYSILQIVFYQVIQLIIIISISVSIGLLVTRCLLPVIYLITYHHLQIKDSIFYFSYDALIETGLIIGVIICTIIFLNIKYAIQSQITTLVDTQNIANYKKDNRSFKMPPLTYVFCYIIGIICMYVGDFTFEFFIPSCIGAIGGYGIFHYCLPLFLQNTMDNKRLKVNQYAIFGNISLFIQQIKTLLLFLFLSIIVLSALLCAEPIGTPLSIQLHVAFIATNVILSYNLVSRFKIDTMSKHTQYKTLYQLGMTWEEIEKASLQEVHYIYAGIWIFIGIYIISILCTFIIHANLPAFFASVIFLEFLILYTISQVLVLYNRKKMITHMKVTLL